MTEADALIEAHEQVDAARLGPLRDDFDSLADPDYWFQRAMQAETDWRLAVKQMQRLEDRNRFMLGILGLLVLFIGLLLWSGG